MVSKMNDSNKNYVNEIRNNYIVNRVLIIYKWMIKRKNSLNFIKKKKNPRYRVVITNELELSHIHIQGVYEFLREPNEVLGNEV